ncbi:ABC transporter substrate-binding protein [Raineyella sp. W15-4]|uniref:ABC transporter substrate-binding protein n=1 Tax=Raineyella sp. W15-4 TaxID=3081651 RepID=UPI0029530A14|nr:ABC transporter substrate-binding protein [Raineyella sp. W15-4]WOQ16501.1 ABC transporter substrate-binding protein [Raineyella sp. W15-4]
MTTTNQPPRRRPRRRALAAVGALLALALPLTGCSTSGSASDAAASTASTPVDGGTLYWGIETKLQTVNPHRNGQDKATPILRNVFDSYVYRNEDGTYEPWLASAYDLSPDGKTVTLTLRQGVTFSDGQPLTAQAVVANFDKIRSTGYLTSIPGGLRFLTSYAADGDTKVTFHLSQADSLFLLYLSTPAASPLSPKSLQLAQSVLESGGPEVAGIGPFTIKSFTPNSELTLAKRADYAWAPASVAKGQAAAHLDTVVYRTFAEGSTRTGSLQQQQVQIASDIQPLDVSVFKDSKDFTYERSAVSGLPYSLYFNVSKAPLDDARVRQAFVQGFDRSAILNSIYAGAFDQAQAPVSVKGPYADSTSLAHYTTDIAAANKLLDDAGWTTRNADGIRTKDGKTLTVRAVSGAPFVRESRDQLNIAIGAALKQNVGIDYQFQIEDLGTESDRAKANDYEVFDNSYGGADPAVGLDLLYSSDPQRGLIARGRFNDATVDRLLDAGRFSNDLTARKATYQQLQTYVTDKYYVLPLYQTQDNLAAVSKVHDITIDGATGQPFGAYKIWLQP